MTGDSRRTTILDITTILWDLGGVLLHFEPEKRLALLSADCGLPTAEVLGRVWGAGMADAWDRGDYENEALYDLVKQTLGLKMGYERFLETMLTPFRSNPELLEVVDAVLLEIRQSVFTNNSRHFADRMPALFPDLVSRFDPMIFSCDLHLIKPNPAAFEAALQVLEAKPGDVVFIDDSPANIASAAAIGMTAIRYESPPQTEAALRELGLIV
ncbi:MAG: HAD family hydrolase [Dehalococcoidia bacterium]